MLAIEQSKREFEHAMENTTQPPGGGDTLSLSEDSHLSPSASSVQHNGPPVGNKPPHRALRQAGVAGMSKVYSPPTPPREIELPRKPPTQRPAAQLSPQFVRRMYPIPMQRGIIIAPDGMIYTCMKCRGDLDIHFHSHRQNEILRKNLPRQHALMCRYGANFGVPPQKPTAKYLAQVELDVGSSDTDNPGFDSETPIDLGKTDPNTRVGRRLPHGRKKRPQVDLLPPPVKKPKINTTRILPNGERNNEEEVLLSQLHTDADSLFSDKRKMTSIAFDFSGRGESPNALFSRIKKLVLDTAIGNYSDLHKLPAPHPMYLCRRGIDYSQSQSKTLQT